jgi:hypothetical protein
MSPTLHQLAALLQCVTASTGLFGFVTNDVRQRSLGDFARKVGEVAFLAPFGPDAMFDLGPECTPKRMSVDPL